ncbi:MAG: Fe-S cluster domain-containing protein [Bacteroidales bacterium]|nr:Fe-S cluster domain-containing protein [Bacteroidales bacterium]MCL2133797.1 Fe-S cluster domain-containing protein [Bacteroidales bacterium]
MNTLIFTILALSILALVLAVVLYLVAQKFKVEEDPRIDDVSEMLPGANCGGCALAGCRAFAEACVKADALDDLFCPVGGPAAMSQIAQYLGKAAPEKEPMVAVVRCAGACDKRERINIYDGALSCAVTANLYTGDTGCSFGCLSKGDCVRACTFGAISMNETTGLPEVKEEKCTACNACVKACPGNIIELRKKGPKNRRIFVSCINKDKGGIAKKACSVSCIGCIKCQKACTFDAIIIENNLAYIDYSKCRLCRKCVPECPTGAIVEVNFPPMKSAAKEETTA